MKKRLLVAAAAISLAAILTGCQNMPEPYAPPTQRQPFENFRPYRISRIIHMSDGDADTYIVKGITGISGGSWRWANKRAEVKVSLRTNQQLKYTADFGLSDETLKSTGPVTVSFYANNHLVDSVHYSDAGIRHFEKPVPAEWFPDGQPAIAALEVDKAWVSPQDGNVLGFILVDIGFTQ